MLATKVMLDQGIHVEGINFFTGFCVEGHTHAIRKQDQNKPKRNNALWVAEQLGIKLHIVDIVDEYKDVLLNPKYGYGANLNPCLDCKIFMVKKALAWMEENGFDFIITGEVVGQRPMSQRKDTMPVVAKRSGAEDRLVRPLCGRNLPATLPEREGWIDRDKLLGFNGRSRKPQMVLAARYGGCCFLTDEQYSRKLTDLWQARGHREYELDDILLLKIGRHVRPAPHYKLIIGREDGENQFLEGYRKQFIHLRTVDVPGPLVLVDGCPTAADLELAARITARYSKGRDAAQVSISITEPAGAERTISVVPLPPSELPEKWLL